MSNRTPDLYTTNLGTIITIEWASVAGRDWLSENIDADDNGGPIDIDHRYAITILYAALAAGLVLEDTTTGQQAVA